MLQPQPVHSSGWMAKKQAKHQLSISFVFIVKERYITHDTAISATHIIIR